MRTVRPSAPGSAGSATAISSDRRTFAGPLPGKKTESRPSGMLAEAAAACFHPDTSGSNRPASTMPLTDSASETA